MKLAKINIHSSAFLILVAFLGCVLTFLFNMFMTRHTTAAIYGDFSLAKQFLSLGSKLCIFGTSASFMRFSKTIEKEKRVTLAQWGILTISKMSLFLFMLLGPFAIFIYSMHHFQIYTYDKYHLAVGILTTAPLVALFTMIVTNLNIEKHSIQSQILAKVFPSGLLALIGLCAAYFLTKDFTYDTIIMLYMVAYLVITSCAGLYYYFYCNAQEFMSSILKSRQKDEENEKKWNTFTRKSFFITTVLSLSYMIEIMSIELILKNEGLLGVYSVCFPIIAFFGLITQNYLYGIKPRIATLLKTPEGKNTLQKEYNKAFSIGFFLIVLFISIIFIYHNTILGYFGNDYKMAKEVLLLLSINHIILFLLYGPIIFLFYSGHENISLRANIFQVCFLLILCPILTYYYSIEGTALSACIVYFIVRTYLYIQSKKYIKFKFFIFF